MRSVTHERHIAERLSHQHCPECRADNQRWHAQTKPFSHAAVPAESRRAYLDWIRPRLEAIRAGVALAKTDEGYRALWWYRDYIAALHKRISSHIRETGRKYVANYARDRMRRDGTDWEFIHAR